MNPDANKKTALAFFERFSAGDIGGALDTMSEDATWRLPGKPEHMPVRGVRSKADIARVFRSMESAIEGNLKMTARSMIGEGDAIAVEATSHGRLKNGRIYDQEYHFAMRFRDGKICEVREYLDTQHAFAVWFTP